VICLAGDGGFAMLLGDLLTTIQEDLPIKIAVYDNGKLGFVDIEQKAAGLVPVYTDLKNPDFGEVAKVVGLWGHRVSKAGELEDAVRAWLAQPGRALLHVKVSLNVAAPVTKVVDISKGGAFRCAPTRARAARITPQYLLPNIER
jgi:pyruvate dehydrogenase (quinone)